MNVKFHDWDCKVVFGKYPNGRTAIQLFDSSTNEPIATATVNIPDAKIEPNQVIIKDYSENEGIYDCLKEAGIIQGVHKFVQVGHTYTLVCDLTEERKMHHNGVECVHGKFLHESCSACQGDKQ